MTFKEQEMLDLFIRIMEQNPVVEKIVTIKENPDCGLYARINGNPCDIPCFAVAKTKEDHWFGLSRKSCQLLYFNNKDIL